MRQTGFFFGAVLTLALALLSPLDSMSGVLFSAHMVQHQLLILAAAPLLVVSNYPVALIWALPRRLTLFLGRRSSILRGLAGLWQKLSRPLYAWLLFTVFQWVWHSPTLYQAALHNETLHALEHFSFLTTAILFWEVLLRKPNPSQGRYGAALPYLFATVMQGGLFGALITLATQPWYPYYSELVIPWGLTPLQDQQLAGLIMWIPGGTLFTLLTILYFSAWLKAFEQRNDRLMGDTSHRESEEFSQSLIKK